MKVMAGMNTVETAQQSNGFKGRGEDQNAYFINPDQDTGTILTSVFESASLYNYMNDEADSTIGSSITWGEDESMEGSLCELPEQFLNILNEYDESMLDDDIEMASFHGQDGFLEGGLFVDMLDDENMLNNDIEVADLHEMDRNMEAGEIPGILGDEEDAQRDQQFNNELADFYVIYENMVIGETPPVEIWLGAEEPQFSKVPEKMEKGFAQTPAVETKLRAEEQQNGNASVCLPKVPKKKITETGHRSQADVVPSPVDAACPKKKRPDPDKQTRVLQPQMVQNSSSSSYVRKTNEVKRRPVPTAPIHEATVRELAVTRKHPKPTSTNQRSLLQPNRLNKVTGTSSSVGRNPVDPHRLIKSTKVPVSPVASEPKLPKPNIPTTASRCELPKPSIPTTASRSLVNAVPYPVNSNTAQSSTVKPVTSPIGESSRGTILLTKETEFLPVVGKESVLDHDYLALCPRRVEVDTDDLHPNLNCVPITAHKTVPITTHKRQCGSSVDKTEKQMSNTSMKLVGLIPKEINSKQVLDKSTAGFCVLNQNSAAKPAGKTCDNDVVKKTVTKPVAKPKTVSLLKRGNALSRNNITQSNLSHQTLSKISVRQPVPSKPGSLRTIPTLNCVQIPEGTPNTLFVDTAKGTTSITSGGLGCLQYKDIRENTNQPSDTVTDSPQTSQVLVYMRSPNPVAAANLTKAVTKPNQTLVSSNSAGMGKIGMKSTSCVTDAKANVCAPGNNKLQPVLVSNEMCNFVSCDTKGRIPTVSKKDSLFTPVLGSLMTDQNSEVPALNTEANSLKGKAFLNNHSLKKNFHETIKIQSHEPIKKGLGGTHVGQSVGKNCQEDFQLDFPENSKCSDSRQQSSYHPRDKKTTERPSDGSALPQIPMYILQTSNISAPQNTGRKVVKAADIINSASLCDSFQPEMPSDIQGAGYSRIEESFCSFMNSATDAEPYANHPDLLPEAEISRKDIPSSCQTMDTEVLPSDSRSQPKNSSKSQSLNENNSPLSRLPFAPSYHFCESPESDAGGSHMSRARSRYRSRSPSRSPSRSRSYHSRRRSRSRSRSPSRSSSRSSYDRINSRSGFRRSRYDQENRGTDYSHKLERRIVFVGNLPDYFTEDLMRERFQKFGRIERIQRMSDKDFGFVTYRDPASATAAIDKGNDVSRKEPKFSLCYGARRRFCEERYADLDGNKALQEEYNLLPKEREKTFEEMLQESLSRKGIK